MFHSGDSVTLRSANIMTDVFGHNVKLMNNFVLPSIIGCENLILPSLIRIV